MNALDQKIKDLLNEVDEVTPAPPGFDELQSEISANGRRYVSVAAALLVAFGFAGIVLAISGRTDTVDRVRTESVQPDVIDPSVTTAIDTSTPTEPATSVAPAASGAVFPQIDEGSQVGLFFLALGLTAVALIVMLVAWLAWRAFNSNKWIGPERQRRRVAVSGTIAQLVVLGVVATTVSAVAESIDDNNSFAPQLDVAIVDYGFDVGFMVPAGQADVERVEDPPARIAPELSPEALTALEAAVPEASIIPVPQVVFDEPARLFPSGELVDEDDDFDSLEVLQSVTVLTSEVAQLLDLGLEQIDVLSRDGFVSTSPSSAGPASIQTTEGLVEVSFDPSIAALEATGQSDGSSQTDQQTNQVGRNFVSPDFVEANDILTTISRYVLVKPTDLSDADRAELDRLVTDDVLNDLAPGTNEQWRIRYDLPNFTRTADVVQGLVSVAVLLLLLARLVTGNRGRMLGMSTGTEPTPIRLRRMLFISIAIGLLATATGYSIAILADEIAARNAIRLDMAFPTITAICVVIIAPLVISFVATRRHQQSSASN